MTFYANVTLFFVAAASVVGVGCVKSTTLEFFAVGCLCVCIVADDFCGGEKTAVIVVIAGWCRNFLFDFRS